MAHRQHVDIVPVVAQVSVRHHRIKRILRLPGDDASQRGGTDTRDESHVMAATSGGNQWLSRCRADFRCPALPRPVALATGAADGSGGGSRRGWPALRTNLAVCQHRVVYRVSLALYLALLQSRQLRVLSHLGVEASESLEGFQDCTHQNRPFSAPSPLGCRCGGVSGPQISRRG